MSEQPKAQGVIMESAEPKSAVGEQPTKASAYVKASNGEPVSWSQLEFFAEGGFMVQPFTNGTLLAFSDGSVILRDNKTKSEYIMKNMMEVQSYIKHGLQGGDEFCKDIARHIETQNKMMAEAIKHMQN